MKVTLKYFGMIAEATQKSNEVIDIETNSNTGDLLNFLKLKYSQMEGLSYRIAVDQTIVDNKTYGIKNGNEIVFLPQFSGG